LKEKLGRGRFCSGEEVEMAVCKYLPRWDKCINMLKSGDTTVDE
jgi:hypothetical protein